jgi:hypothetical protein
MRPRTSNAAAREPKRAKDREAQRLNRIRTKAYISQLENEAAELCQASASQHELGSTVENQFGQLREVSEKLQRTLNQIGRLARGVSTHLSSEAAEDDGLSTPPTEPKTGAKDSETRHEREALRAGSNYTEVEIDAPFLASAGPDAYQTRILHGLSPSDPNTQVVLVDFFKVPQHEQNMFTSMDNMINILRQNLSSGPVFDRSNDDDTCIRAVVFGWDTVPSKSLDSVWTAINALDRMIFRDCGVVERVAMVSLLRLLLLNLISPARTGQRQLPVYMQPTATQMSIPHSQLIDAVVWPSLRDLLIVTGCKHVTQQQLLRYAEDLMFEWPYEVRDIYMHETNMGRYSMSKEYKDRLFSAQCWTLRPGRCKCVFQRPIGDEVGICGICDLELDLLDCATVMNEDVSPDNARFGK